MATSGHMVIGVGPGEQEPVPVPYVLSFTDLCYSVTKRRGRNQIANTDTNSKALLDGISGQAREGELFAVMGASKAGKSTLLDALAGRITRGSLRGGVTLNGEPLTGCRLRAISAYVMQDDLLYPMLTVRETLLFAAEFRLPRALSAARKSDRVDAIIRQLGLSGAGVGRRAALRLYRRRHHPRPLPVLPRRAHVWPRLRQRLHGGPL